MKIGDELRKIQALKIRKNKFLVAQHIAHEDMERAMIDPNFIGLRVDIRSPPVNDPQCPKDYYLLRVDLRFRVDKCLEAVVTNQYVSSHKGTRWYRWKDNRKYGRPIE